MLKTKAGFKDSPQEPEEIEEEVLEILDPNFKYALLNTNCVDTNNVQIGETDLDFNYNYF